MTTNAIEKISTQPVALPSHVGQATAVEQARAVAEVLAAVQVAQQNPRNIQAAIAAMRESTSHPALAERAFFRFPRAGGTVSGESVQLARELARCWTNIQHGITELSRDNARGQSEMQSFAWDVQANTRVTNTFIVPHLRDTRDGAKPIVDLRDVYENNANLGARRVRECIFAVLPRWFVEEAKDQCAKTLADGGGKPLAQRVADAIKTFGTIGVTEEQLADKLGRKTGQWTEPDVAQLGVIFKSIQRGEVTRDEEFPTQRVTLAEITAQAAAKTEPEAQP